MKKFSTMIIGLDAKLTGNGLYIAKQNHELQSDIVQSPLHFLNSIQLHSTGYSLSDNCSVIYWKMDSKCLGYTPFSSDEVKENWYDNLNRIQDIENRIMEYITSKNSEESK